jgi:hypothetical protein
LTKKKEQKEFEKYQELSQEKQKNIFGKIDRGPMVDLFENLDKEENDKKENEKIEKLKKNLSEKVSGTKMS